jgi:hypothetical protein
MNIRLDTVGRYPRILFLKKLLLPVLIFMHGAALADSNDDNQVYNQRMDSRYNIWIGGFFPQVESSIRLDSNLASPGDKISFENVLGLEDSKTTLWGGFRWRISRRNNLEFEFNNLNRNGEISAISEDLDIGEETIKLGASINTTFDLTLGRISYGFSAIRTQKHELALKAGFHIAGARLKIDARGDILNVDTGMTICNPSPCQANVETDNYTLPLPHLGLAYNYAFSPKWALRAQGIGFALKVNDIKGSMVELDLDLNYQLSKHVGIGGSIRYWDLNVEDKGDTILRGEFEYKYWGPAFYVIGSF